MIKALLLSNSTLPGTLLYLAMTVESKFPRVRGKEAIVHSFCAVTLSLDMLIGYYRCPGKIISVFKYFLGDLNSSIVPSAVGRARKARDFRECVMDAVARR